MLRGICVGCYQATQNNFLVDVHGFEAIHRGFLELFREFPGLMLVFLLVPLHRVSDWKILRLSAVFGMLGVALLCLPLSRPAVVFAMVVWSLGEHLAMPVRSAIGMQVAADGRGGEALGLLGGISNGGSVFGNLLVAAVFWVWRGWFSKGASAVPKVCFYDGIWLFIFVLMGLGLLFAFTRQAPDTRTRRPRLFFHSKFRIFYGLELFYGVRKQVFYTFGPFVLIKNYGVDTAHMGLLMGLVAAGNMFFAPLVGRLVDRLGYRTVMFYDTVVLFFVCLLYGFAGDWFPPRAAVWVVGATYLLDGLISTTSMATNLYVRDLAENREEMTSTLSTGISINHLISILVGPLGGLVWAKFGVGVLFTFSAVMAIANSVCAMCIPRKVQNA
ncbi:MAG: MFS transporter [Kiritimatiellia bacterium]